MYLSVPPPEIPLPDEDREIKLEEEYDCPVPVPKLHGRVRPLALTNKKIIQVDEYRFSALPGDSLTYYCSEKTRRDCNIFERIQIANLPQLQFLKIQQEFFRLDLFQSKFKKVSCQTRIVTTPRGAQLLMFQSHTFSRSNKNSYIWTCSSRSSRKCPAKVTYKMDTLIPHEHEHNHPPPILEMNCLHIERIQVGKRKRTLLMIQDFTFAQTTSDHRYWNCSSKYSAKCPAKLRFNDSGQLIFHELVHNHDAPSFFRTKDGSYVKL
ncbi:hypothetical protein PYW08_016030 [Mythimna loreyi]|uniref:Uncharacterized protein n=1 Tax=Mythimna loreyi TaxID=667449 RepID=A0ACC2QUL3_9NEOP|nr:hypothetical protein PYW08_016030 [Mythimna loreyi]